MSSRVTVAGRAFGVTVISWLLFTTLFALPVLAEEEEDDDTTTTTTSTTTTTTTSSTTTSTTSTTTSTTTTTTTTPSTTTTTTTPSTTTTTTQPSTTTTTSDPAPTTTAPSSTTSTTTTELSPSESTTTTTTVAEDEDEDAGAQPPGGSGPGGAEIETIDQTSAQFVEKDDFVITFRSIFSGAEQDMGDGSTGRWHIDPRENLSVALNAMVETLESQILAAVILGAIVATLTVVGVDRASGRIQEPEGFLSGQLSG